MNPDPDDIIRAINLESPDYCTAEITRLMRSRTGFKAAFTEYVNIFDKLITASLSTDGTKYSNSKKNLLKLDRAFEKLETRYEKCMKLNMRVIKDVLCVLK